MGGAQSPHPGDDAVARATAPDEQRLDDAEPANRSLEILNLRAIFGRQLNLGERNLTHGAQRRLAEQLVDVVRRMPHAKPRWQSFADRSGRRRFVGLVFPLVVSLVVPLFVEFRERSSFFERRHVFVLSNDHSRLLHKLHGHFFFELSDVCC